MANLVYRKSTTPTTNVATINKGNLLTNDEVDGNFYGIQLELDLKAPINNAVFTGTTTIPNAAINGGAINGTVIGAVSPVAGTFSSLNTTGNLSVGNSADDILSVQAGTAALPSLVKVGDTDTGVWFPADNEIAVSTGGVQRLLITNTQSTVTGDATITGDLAVNGADVTTTSTGTATLFNANATTLNIGGAATSMTIGATTGTATIRNANVTLSGDLAVNGGDVTSSATTFNLLDSTVTTLNLARAGTAITIGATTGTTTIRNATTAVTGNLTVGNGASVTGTLSASGATTLSSTLGVTGATTLSSTLGVTGATTLSSTLAVTGNTTLNSNVTLVGSATPATELFVINDGTTTRFFVDSANGNTSVAGTLGVTGATTLSSTLGVTGAVTLSSTLAVNGNTTLGDAAGDSVTITGTAVSIPNNLNFDSNTLFIDAANNRIGIGNNSPAQTLSVTGTASVSGNTTVGGTFDVTGATTLGTTLGVTGATTLSSTLGVTGLATFNAGVTVAGNTSAATEFFRVTNGAGSPATTFLIDTASGDTSIAGTLGVTGASSFSTVSATSVSASTLTSTVATGTAPLTVTSTTRVTNLNADSVDGFGISTVNTSGTAGVDTKYGIAYAPATSTGTISWLAPGSNGQILESTGVGGIPRWIDLDAIQAGNAALAANVSGGNSGDLLYQSAADSTAKLPIGSNGTILTSNGSAPVWSNTVGSVTVSNANGFSHNGLTMTAGTNVDQLYTVTETLTVTTAWVNTSINAAELPTGSYMVQITTGTEVYTGMMSWYSANINSAVVDEIVLHKASAGTETSALFLRVERTDNDTSPDMTLQISSSESRTSASYTFRFRRMM